jgi:hypothetical protein
MRKLSWWKLVALSSGGILLALCLGFFVVSRAGILSYVMEDGPFHGRPAKDIPERDPDQVFPISNKLTLRVFDDPNGKQSPIVQLVDSDGDAQWAIYADGNKQDDVRSIRFENVDKGLLHCRVEGTVDWTYGKEATWWHIGRSGRLYRYWYSW